MAFATLKQLADDIDLGVKGPTTFNVGDRAISRLTGKEVVITEGYQQHLVRDPSGDTVDRDNGRASRLFGYMAQRADGKTFFVRAGGLLDLDDRERHVQLVWPAKAEPVVEPKPKKARSADPFESALLKPYADKLDAATLRMMGEAVAEGFAQGRTTQQIIASIRRAEVSHA